MDNLINRVPNPNVGPLALRRKWNPGPYLIRDQQFVSNTLYVFPNYPRLPFRKVGPVPVWFNRPDFWITQANLINSNITDSIAISETPSPSGSIFNQSIIDAISIVDLGYIIDTTFKYPTYPKQPFRKVGPAPLWFIRPQYYNTQVNQISNQTIIDTLALSDNGAGNKIVIIVTTDSINPAEALVESDIRNQAISDNLTISDNIIIVKILTRSLVDNITIIDVGATAGGIRLSDLITIIESAYYAIRHPKNIGSVVDTKITPPINTSPPDIKVVSAPNWNPPDTKVVSSTVESVATSMANPNNVASVPEVKAVPSNVETEPDVKNVPTSIGTTPDVKVVSGTTWSPPEVKQE